MFLIAIVFIAGLSIEVLGTIISVAGVAASFNGNLVIIAFILALDIGKIVTISALYQYWETLTWKFKLIGPVTILVTMLISSAGAYGYFSSEFEKSMVGTRDITTKITMLQTRLAKYEADKREIDALMTAIPEKTSVTQRLRMIRALKQERQSLISRISEIEDQLPALISKQISDDAKTGPILAVSRTLDVSIETALKFVVGLLILIFNPFAVFLIYLGNFMIKKQNDTPPIPKSTINKNRTRPKSDYAYDIKAPVWTETITTFPSTKTNKDEKPSKQNVKTGVDKQKLGDDADNLVFEPDPVISDEENNRRQQHVSLLLDKALDSVRDNTEITATPMVDTYTPTMRYKKTTM